jgi:hypothetical protein
MAKTPFNDFPHNEPAPLDPLAGRDGAAPSSSSDGPSGKRGTVRRRAVSRTFSCFRCGGDGPPDLICPTWKGPTWSPTWCLSCREEAIVETARDAYKPREGRPLEVRPDLFAQELGDLLGDSYYRFMDELVGDMLHELVGARDHISVAEYREARAAHSAKTHNISWSPVRTYDSHGVLVSVRGGTRRQPASSEAMLTRILWLDRELVDVEKDGVRAKPGKRRLGGKLLLGALLADERAMNLKALEAQTGIRRTSLNRWRNKSESRPTPTGEGTMTTAAIEEVRDELAALREEMRAEHEELIRILFAFKYGETPTKAWERLLLDEAA